MIYTMDEIRAMVKTVADDFDIQEIRLFGSYYDGSATEKSDLDFVVTYGPGCRGLDRIGFMMALEEGLKKDVDVINIKFKPEFMDSMDLEDERRLVYVRENQGEFKIAY